MSARRRTSQSNKQDIVSASQSKVLRDSKVRNPQRQSDLIIKPTTSQIIPHQKINMQKIFQANKQYLMQKVLIKQIPKPSKYYHKIPSSTPKTTYNNQYDKSKTHYGSGFNVNANQLKLERKDNLFNGKQNIGDYESLYGQNFNNKQRSQSLVSTAKKDNPFMTLDANYQRQKSKKYQPNDAPTFLDTSYSLNFPGNYHPMPAQLAKRNECKLMGGGKFNGETTYHGTFSNKKFDHKSIQKQRPITHQDNKIFMSIVQPKQTTYDHQFNATMIPMSKSVKIEKKQKSDKKSEIKGQFSQLTKTNYNNGVKLNSQRNNYNKKTMYATIDKQYEQKKYKSEYERSFKKIQQDTKTKAKNISLMTVQEMKNLILNVL